MYCNSSEQIEYKFTRQSVEHVHNQTHANAIYVKRIHGTKEATRLTNDLLLQEMHKQDKQELHDCQKEWTDEKIE